MAPGPPVAPVAPGDDSTVEPTPVVRERSAHDFADDLEAVTRLLGRVPKTAFTVVVRGAGGVPVVTRNAPFEHDGTPMPTRYWLLPSSRASEAIGRLEAAGGVRRVETIVSAEAIAAAHAAYAADRDRDIPADHVGPRPSGGVGGTRVGTKCLHAHYAFFLAGGLDPVGRWVYEQLEPSERDAPIVSAELFADPEPFAAGPS